MKQQELYKDAVKLLQQLIATPSFSREEDRTASLIFDFFKERNIVAQRYLNNVWACNRNFDPSKPVLLLNSHHDTVKPNPQYSRDPFEPALSEGRLFGLGSNDAGGPLVALITAFLYFQDRTDLPWNLVIAATAEEEISGTNGIEALLSATAFRESVQLKAEEDFVRWSAIVGEPTQMQLAVAEKGLLVLDCVAHGKAGHAAREEGVNAIYEALDDIQWFRDFRFPKVSPTLGPVKMNVTVAGTENKAHNMVPASCHFTVDIRVTDVYRHEEILEQVRASVKCDVTPRSLRMRATGINPEHPLVLAGLAMERKVYGSPTCSDKALMPFQALKCGPGDSARSHTADEFIWLEEIEQGIAGYIEMINRAMEMPGYFG